MDITIVHIIKAFLMPPAILIILFVIAAALYYLRRPAAKPVFITSLVLLYLLSIPLVTHILTKPLEPYPPLTDELITQNERDIIVVLGAGKTRGLEYGTEHTPTGNALIRLRYAAWLHRKTGLPVVVAGGSVKEGETPEAELMARALKEEYGVAAVYKETRSRNTAQNAIFTSELMQSIGKNKAFLVTQAWHMPRSMLAFESIGADVLPAPTGFETGELKWEFNLIMPEANAFRETTYALHEWLGYLWYLIRY